MKQRTRCFVLLAALAAATQLPGHAQTTAVPPTTTTTTAAPAATAKVPKPAVRMGGPDGLPSRDQCTPVTPETKVPWIEVSELPALGPDYWSWCTDLDSAWTTQSYPNPKYEPNRTPEHKERVQRFLAGLKDYVRAESDDWVGYVNEWLGTDIPTFSTEQNPFKNGDIFISYKSHKRRAKSNIFNIEYDLISLSGTQVKTTDSKVTSNKRMFGILEINVTQFCVTPIDLQQAFESKPGYLFRPMSVRTSLFKPDSQEIEKRGGQWWGYEVEIFPDPSQGNYRGRISLHFGYRPCLTQLNINLNEIFHQGENK